MKKLFILSYFLFLISYSLFAQNVGIGTPTPNGNAMLDISSTSKGLLIPRLTTTQMNGIPAAVSGLLVYNTDSAAFAYANGSAWVYLKGNSTGSNDWSTKGNAGTNAATNFIGTTDNVNLIFKRNNIRAGLISFANISLGEQALNPATTGFFNIAFGEKAMYSNTTGSYNTATGYSALKDNTGGGGNTAAGMGALTKNVTGNNNTAIGASAMFTNSSGNDNTAVGFQSLFGNQNSGYQNTALGSYSMGFNTTGMVNTAVGSYALNANADGWGNAAIGYQAMYGNISGNANVAIGDSTLAGNSAGSYNTAVGPYAGFTSNGDKNVFIGHEAGYFNSGSNKLYISNTGSDAANTLLYGEFDNKILSIGGKLGIGILPDISPFSFPLNIKADGGQRLFKMYNNSGNEKWHLTLLGNNSLNFVESNIADYRLVLGVGGEAGVGKVPLVSNDDSRLQIKQKNTQNGIGIEAPNSTNHWDFYVTTEVASNFNLYYNGAYKGTFDNVTGAYTAISDRRLKKDITPQLPVLNNVMQLQTYQYHYLDNKITDRFSNGFMAQDVQKIFPDAVIENVMKDGEKRLGINYQYFTVLAIKGLQEQQQQVKSQEEKITMQEERIAKLEALVKAITDKK